MKPKRNPYERLLFWTTFVAVWFDTSRAWTETINHIVDNGISLSGLIYGAVLVLATLHLWWGGRHDM